MEYLYKVYRKYDYSKYKSEMEKRASSSSRVNIDFHIRQYNHKKVNQLYFIPTLKMLNLVERVSREDVKIEKLFQDLPIVAQTAFKRELIINELQSTNEIEGVSSTKVEIASSLRIVEGKETRKGVRFESIVRSYLNIFNEKLIMPRLPADIRKIYEQVVSDEIKKEDGLNGELFRDEDVQVVTSSQKVLHEGISGQEEITDAMKKMLTILNDDSEIPEVIRIAVGHYLFGYIHPFYDGNGRVSRYLNSLYLSKSHSGLTAVSLSKSINQNKKKYYEIFRNTNAEISNGELNNFIENFIEFIAEGQQLMNEELITKYKLIDKAFEKIEKEKLISNKSVRYFDTLFIIAQNDLFDNGSPILAKEMAHYLSVSTVTARQTLNELIEIGLVESEGTNPKYYYPKRGYFEKDLNSNI